MDVFIFHYFSFLFFLFVIQSGQIDELLIHTQTIRTWQNGYLLVKINDYAMAYNLHIMQ